MNKIIPRSAALVGAGALLFSMAACGQSASSAASSADSSADSSTASSQAAAEETDPLALAAMDFSYSDALDENGYFSGVTALDFVTLPEDYLSIALTNDDVTATDEEIQSQLDALLANYANSVQITDRAVENGDVVNIDYVGSVGGVEFTGGNTNGAGVDVTAGSSGYIDDFLTQIIGHMPGEEMEIVVTFPEGYNDSTDAEGNTVVLAGQEAVFVTTINYISESEPAELTDDFVAEHIDPSYGSTAEEFLETLHSDLNESKRQQAVMDYLMDNSTFAEELPDAVVDYYLNVVLHYYYIQYAEPSGMTLTELVTSQMGYTDIQSLVDDNLTAVQDQAKQSLLYQAIAEDNQLVCGSAEVDSYFNDQMQLSDYSSYETQYGANYLRMTVLNENAFALVNDGAVVA